MNYDLGLSHKMTDDRKIVTTGKHSLTIQPGSGAANVIDKVLSDALALARSSQVSKEVFTEINGIMFDQLSVKQLEIWAETILIDQDEDSATLAEITLSQLVELMNSTFFELKSDDRFIGVEHWACDGKIVAACFPQKTNWFGLDIDLDLSQVPGLIILWVDSRPLNEERLERDGEIFLPEDYWVLGQLTELNVSNSPGLTELWASGNQLTQLDVSNNSELTVLCVPKNQLTELDVSNNPELTKLDVGANALTKLVSKNPGLTELCASGNQLTKLDVSNNSELSDLNVSSNKLTELNVSNNPELTKLTVDDNQLNELDVSNNPKLNQFFASGNQLTELDLSNNPELSFLDVDSNQLTELDLSNNPDMSILFVSEYHLTELRLSNEVDLENNIGGISIPPHLKFDKVKGYFTNE